MKKISWIIVGIILIGLVVFRLTSNKKTTESKVYQFNKEKPIVVSVDSIRLRAIDTENSYTGIFEPNKESKISSDIQGKINAVLVDVGSQVRKGQTLVQLDNSLLKYQLQTIEVQIEGLENDVKRYTILAEADAVQGIQLEKTKLNLKSAKIQQASLVEQIRKTAIKAPFNGVITAKLNEVGGFAAPAVPLLQITDISSLRFTINIPENDLIYFQTNQAYKISADLYPDFPLVVTTKMIGSKANSGNSFPIQFHVNNINNLSIKAGMFGKLSLSDSKQNQGIVIPSSAIIKEKDKLKVYLIKNGKAIIQPIIVGENVGNSAVVSSGLNQGDVIVTNGFINLFDGANITIK